MTQHWRESIFGGLLLAALLPVAALAQSTALDDAFDRRVSDSGSRSALDTYVIEAVREGQYDQALSTLEEVLFASPNDVDARLALARLYYHIGSYDVASAHLEQIDLFADEDIARQVEELKRLIERARNGWETRLAVTAGGAYREATQRVQGFFPFTTTRSVYTPYVIIDGEIVRLLDSPTRDEVRFGGTATYDQALSDLDFDGDLETFDATALRGHVTYSKGVPELSDTARIEITGYGFLRELGAGRQHRELGTEAEFSVQPTVESRVRYFVGYGWLGDSQNLFGEHRVRYGVAGEMRVAPGVVVGGSIKGYNEWGEVPQFFGAQSYTAHGYELGGSIGHLLYVFEDGKSWVHRIGGRYANERVLDYGSVSPFQVDLIDRETWEVYWDHTVQVATRAEVNLRVSYGEERISDTLLFFSADRDNDFWGIKTGITYRFN
ncbi:tetratricopeptide repeat protein [Oricola sp.]|uniref:tetratricopeptide repeat protein n=1 Tax=Oricola sp. TaxID=1979950 RepID=UPI003BA894E0